MKYSARFPSPSIEKKFWKDLSDIPRKAQDEILAVVGSLEENPRPFGQKPFKQLVPPTHIYSFVAQYRVRIGDYRVLYDVDDKRKIVWVFAVRRRSEKTYRS